MMRKIKRKIRHRNIVFDIFGAALLGAILIGVVSFLWPKGASAAWFNEDWTFRKSIAISAHTASENNVYINLTGANDLDTSDTTRFQADCGDLRFTKQNGELLPYYIASGCGTADTVVHVNFDTFPAGAQTIYYYYGNPSATNDFSSADFSTEATNYTIGSQGSEEKGAGPVAYWKFDDGQGQTTQDSTSNNNDGTLGANTGASTDDPTWTTEDQCISGKCLKFDGGDYVGVTQNSSINFNQSNSFTISAWVKTNSLGAARFIVDKQENVGNEFCYALAMNSSNHFYFETCKQNVAAADAVGTSTITANTWYHVTGVSNGSNVYLYVNGALEHSTSIGFSSATVSAANLTLGMMYNSSGYWNGFIDDVKIYPYAKTAAQVKQDFETKSGAATAQGSSAVLGASNQKYLSDGLVGYWKMDEASGDTIDSSGNGNTGTSTGTTVSSGKFGNSRTTSTSSTYVQIADNNTLDVSSEFTISAWIYPTTLGVSERGIIIKADPTAWGANNNNHVSYGIAIGSTGYLYAFADSDGDWGPTWSATESTIGSQTNRWQHVVAVFDGKTLKLYRDGALIATSSSVVGTVRNTSNPIIIGYNLNWTNPFAGSIDEARIYNRAFSPKEVSDLYNWAPGPVGYWNFEENTGTAVNNTSGTGTTNNGSWNGTGSHWKTGKIGATGNFDGSSDYVQINAGNSLNLNSDVTLESWINVNNVTGNKTILARYYGTSNIAPYYITTVGNQIRAYFAKDWSSNYIYRDTTAANLVAGTWYHIAAVYNLGGAIKIFVNGVEQAGTTTSVGTVNALQSGDVATYLGAYESAGIGGYFSGKIDEAKVYNYARSAKQIVSDMNADHPSVGSPVGSAVGYWKFDEGTDNKCSGGTNDVCNSGSGGSALDGAESGMAIPATSTSGWTNAGKFGKALNFDGSNDVITVPDNSALDVTTDFTLSTWIRRTAASVAAGQKIIAKGSSAGTTGAYVLDLTATNSYLRCYVENGVGFPVTGTTSLNDNNWHYVSCTRDSSNNWKLYLDGILHASGTSTNVPTNTVANLGIGAYNDGSSSGAFPGSIDEVKIYPYALTPDEVKLDYNRGSSEVLGTLSTAVTGRTSESARSEYCPPGNTETNCAASSDPSPLARWDFEEGTGTNTFDTSGQGYTGAITNGSWANGKNGKALSFNGNNTLVLASTPATTATNNITLEAWVKWSGSTGGHQYILHNGNGGVNGYGLMVRKEVGYNDVIAVMSSGVEWTSSTTQLTAGQWQHLVGMRDAGTWKIYLNGNQLSVTGNPTPLTPATYTHLGAGQTSFNGLIDGAKIFNYVRTPAQIAWDYNKGKPVGWWKMDECQGGYAYDSSGNSNTGTITIGASGEDTLGTCTTSSTAWGSGATGKRNASLSLDGTDDKVENSSVNFGLNGATSLSVSAWVYPALNGGFVVDKHYENAPDQTFDTFFVTTEANGSTIIRLSNGTTGAYPIWQTSASSLPANQWSHIAFSWSRVNGNSTDMKVYINGVSQTLTHTANSYSSSFTILENATKFLIGARYTSSYNNYYQGQIDDVKIFNYALSTAQVKDIYNGGAINFGPSTGSP